MANVTDSVFRRMIAKYGKPDVTWTEFVSADGLVSAGQKRLLPDLKFSEKERPIVAQLFTGHPDVMMEAAKLVARLKFDGLDINMGCPDRAVERQGGGAAMIKEPKLALAVIKAAREGVGPKIPVSVKTRIGYYKIDLEWIGFLLGLNLPALTIHLRTRKEMSDVPAHWELMPEIIRLRDEIQADLKPSERTLIIGNGDVENVEKGREFAAKYGCDGIMIGRGIFGKPWLFSGDTSRSPAVRLKILLEHSKLFEKTYCITKTGQKPIKNFEVMKKHFKSYVSGWDGAKELRAKLMECESAAEVEAVINA
jgi:tRNA-dihydrouridine synthase